MSGSSIEAAVFLEWTGVMGKDRCPGSCCPLSAGDRGVHTLPLPPSPWGALHAVSSACLLVLKIDHWRLNSHLWKGSDLYFSLEDTNLDLSIMTRHTDAPFSGVYIEQLLELFLAQVRASK